MMVDESKSAPPAADSFISTNVRRFFSGAVSGTVTAAILQPFDVIRTVQQGQQAGHDGAAVKRIGPVRTAKQLVAEGGVTTLWRGLGPTVTRVFLGAGVYFTTIHALHDALKGHDTPKKGQTASAAEAGGRVAVEAGAGGGAGTSRLATSSSSSSGIVSDSARSFLAGFIARTLAATLLSPVAVVKTRMEWAGKGTLPYRSTLGGLVHIAKAEGVGALYAGLIPTLVRDSPFSGMYYMIYSKLKEIMESPTVTELIPSSAVRNFASATTAGALATMLTQPADVIRTRLQIGAVPGVGVWQTGTILYNGLRDLAVKEGFQALFIGGVARIAKRSLSTAVTWTLFEEAMKKR